MKKPHLPHLITSAFFLILSFIIASCNSDSDSSDSGNVSSGLKGWYTDLSSVAKQSDFNKLNEAINNHEELSSYYYGGQTHRYIASRDLFFYSDGMYNDSDAYFGRLRFSIKSFINAIRIIDNQTLVFYIGYLYEDGAGNDDAIYKFYAGPIFKNMTYYGEGFYYTYTKYENKIIVSNGDIYTITSGGLIKDGNSAIWSKYDPSKRY